MKVNPRLCVLAFVVGLFVLSLAFGPTGSLASRSDGIQDRTAGQKGGAAPTKPEKPSDEGKTDPADIDPSERGGAQPASHKRVGVLKRISGFVKDVFVPNRTVARSSGKKGVADRDRPRVDESEGLGSRETHSTMLRA